MRFLIGCLVVVLSACTGNPGPSRTDGSAEQLTIAVQPLGTLPQVVLDSVDAALSREHKAIVRMLPVRELPQHAFTELRTPRYRADTLIAWLRTIKPDSVDLIIGITAQDISVTKVDSTGAVKEPAWKYRDFGIFGLGYRGGPSCVVSTHRLGDGKSMKFFDRLKKVAVHEVGHNRWLPHCPDTHCVMRSARERMRSVDEAEPGFCAACAERLTPSRSPSALWRWVSVGS